LPLLLKAGAIEATSWRDIVALCQVAGEQVLLDGPLTSTATVLQLAAMLDLADAHWKFIPNSTQKTYRKLK